MGRALFPWRLVAAGPWLLMVAGVGLLAAAGILYSEFLGFTDVVLMEEGILAVRLPWSGELLQTGFRTEDLWGEARRLAYVGLGMASVVGLVLGIRWRGALAGFLARRPRGWQGVMASLLLLAVLAAFIPLGDGGAVLGLYFALGTSGFGLLLSGALGLLGEKGGVPGAELRPVAGASPAGLAAGAPPAATALARGLESLAVRSPWIVIPVLALVLLTSASLVSLLVFGGVPHVVDGVSYLFQARILASGHFFLPSHPLPEFFHVDTIVNDGRWFSQYTPGHTVLLLLGDRGGAPWLVNPVLGALTVPALYLLGREVYDGKTALLAILLAVLSPFVVFMSGEYFSHASAFLFVTLFLLHYLRLSRSGSRREALLAGLFLGLAVLSRPLTALAVAVPCGVDTLVSLVRDRGARGIVGPILLSGVTLGFVGLLLLYNRETTGALLTFGYGQAVGPGFGWGDTISLTRTLERVRLLNDALLGWPVPSLLLALFAFLGGRPQRPDYLLAGVFLSLLAAHATVAYSDTEFGPRYLYEASGALLLLSARGFWRMHEGLQRLFGRSFEARDVRSIGALALALAFLYAAVGAWVPRVGLYGSPEWYWARNDDAVEAVKAAGIGNAVVFVREPAEPSGKRRWEAAFLHNGLFLDSAEVIFARDLGEKNEELMEHYPDRRYFLADTASLIPLHPPGRSAR